MERPGRSADGAPARRPAVAGSFYPGRAAEVDQMLARLMPEGRERVQARGALVPHAGWEYSGRVAGAVYARLRVPRWAVVLGPNHTGLGRRGSIMCRGRWDLPGGAVPIAEPLARAILAASRVLEEDEAAHRQEHAIEVQLPFLRRLEPAIAFVPITLWGHDLDFCRDVGRAVAAAVGALHEPALIVCSSDLNHYESQAVSQRKDQLAIDAVLSLDPARLEATVDAHGISMCGVAPAMATLAALEVLGGGRAELVRYGTSGDVLGDYEHVVGYAGIILY
jgi:AmmeMemoRadiSam system protein B